PLLRVARARGRSGRDGLLDAREVVVHELDVQRTERLVEPLTRSRADQRDDVVAAAQHPGDGDLRDAHAPVLRDRPQRLHERQVVLEVLALEARGVRAEVAALAAALARPVAADQPTG